MEKKGAGEGERGGFLLFYLYSRVVNDDMCMIANHDPRRKVGEQDWAGVL